MRFYSTAGRIKDVSFQEAVLDVMAPDGGLYLPDKLPFFSPELLKKTRGLSFLELSVELGKILFENVLEPSLVEKICEEAFNFPTPFLHFPNDLYLLELFHGPTLSFKDFGARFLASLLYAWRKQDQEIIVLAATSGDTGSAVGSAFCGRPGVSVYILYPKGRITPTQEQHLTTIGHNVKAVQVQGSFDDCQRLLKQALLDPELKRGGIVTTANSINVARLFPQALYYFYAYSQLPEYGPEALFSVPCGNFGHLVSGILAKRMGLPVARFLGATNINNEVPLFLQTGAFRPHESYPSMAVSMDVGNPSNFPRLLSLYENSIENLRVDLLSSDFTDAQIAEGIQEIYRTYGYLLDPHSATAYLALKEYPQLKKKGHPGILFATAHPSKFTESLSEVISHPIPLHEHLQAAFTKSPNFITLPPSYESLKELLYTKIKI